MIDAQGLGLVRFRGVNFRNEAVSCKCGWRGRAAGLKTPDLPKPGEAMRYLCPGCSGVLAAHPGLSDAEVIQAMRMIRRELAAELSGGSCLPAAVPGESPQKIDFAAVRAQIRVGTADEAHGSGGGSGQPQ